VGLPLGSREGRVSNTVGVIDGPVGCKLGMGVAVGFAVGIIDGVEVVGLAVGFVDGTTVEIEVGIFEGNRLGR